MKAPLDVVVIGAGAAGLVALQKLTVAGLDVVCLEARDRIGGRIHTYHDPHSPVPIELGPEFVHGRPPETWQIIERALLTVYDCTEHSLHIENGTVQNRSDAWLMVEDILSAMKHDAANGPDQSFTQFLDSHKFSFEARQAANSYIQGFNAARADLIGIRSLAQDAAAAEAIDGDRSFRILNGYAAVTQRLLSEVPNTSARLRLSTIVHSIEWSAESVLVRYHSALTGRPGSLRAKRAIITVPLGVLQAAPGLPGSIRFEPQPKGIFEAARQLLFGQVLHVVLRFRERIWERNADFAEAGFLLSNEPDFPTWWTPLPIRAPLLTGWSAGAYAEGLLHADRKEVIGCALSRLSRILSIPEADLDDCFEQAYFHDWHNDPFARGAYSYAPVNGMDARKVLAEPVHRTLFFAGEATETNGHSATVHGALATGARAASQVLSSLG